MVSVQVDELRKNYGTVTAVKDISVSIAKGTLFGFIGPDGAGKTTLFRILSTLLLPDSGTASVEGFDVVKDYKQIRQIIGFMPGRFSLYHDLSVEENLAFYATVFGTTIQENYHLIKDIYCQIEPFKKRKAGKLSGGMKQKLALSCAMIHKPQVLFLDEPTTGVDAVSRKEFWDILKRLKENGITILVSTPYMDEAGLCDRIALMQNGMIMRINTPDEVITGFTRELLAVRSHDIYQLLQDLRKYPLAQSVYAFGQTAHLTLSETHYNRCLLKDYLVAKGHQDIGIDPIRPCIEDCFMELMDAGKQEV